MRAFFLFLLICGLLPLSGCDSPACVFTPGGCNGTGAGGSGGGPGAAGSLPAGNVATGSWIPVSAPGAPILWPESGVLLQPGSILALEFSGSMEVESLTGAIEMIDSVFGTPIPLLDPPPLVADGRIALLVPSQPLIPGSQYTLSWALGAEPADVLGRPVSGASGAIGAIGVSGEPSLIPRVVLAYPHDEEAAAGDLTEVLVIFDQPMRTGDFSTSSFAVKVDGAEPPANPAPLPVSIPGAVPVPVTQAWVLVRHGPRRHTPFSWCGTTRDLEPLFLRIRVVLDVRRNPASHRIHVHHRQFASTRVSGQTLCAHGSHWPG